MPSVSYEGSRKLSSLAIRRPRNRPTAGLPFVGTQLSSWPQYAVHPSAKGRLPRSHALRLLARACLMSGWWTPGLTAAFGVARTISTSITGRPAKQAAAPSHLSHSPTVLRGMSIRSPTADCPTDLRCLRHSYPLSAERPRCSP